MGQFLDIAETVLAHYSRPMKPKEIVDLAKDDALFSDKLAGETPHQTMKAKLSVDLVQRGDNSRFIRTAPNTFFLRRLHLDPTPSYTAVRQRPSWRGENVLVFPTPVLEDFGRHQGISRAWRPLLEKLADPDCCYPKPRLNAEQTEDEKQLLTYIMVTRGTKLLCFRRGAFNRVEDYLRGSLCVGFGGHISDRDQTLYNHGNFGKLVKDNAARELFEELHLPQADRRRLAEGRGLKILGVLNDDSSSTGRKHLAVVLQYEASTSKEWLRPWKGEKSINQLKWLDLRSLNEELRDFEYWSQLCLVTFFPNSVRTQPSWLLRRKSPFRGSHLLCITGGLGSGKSAATKVLVREFGYSEINSGCVLANLLRIPPVPESSRETFQAKAWEFIRKTKGPERFATALLNAAGRTQGKPLIDGIRQRATINELQRQASPRKVALLYVYTPPHIAYQFYQERQGEAVDINSFLKLSDAPAEGEVRKLIADADAVLYNWSGKLKYMQAVRGLMEEIDS